MVARDEHYIPFDMPARLELRSKFSRSVIRSTIFRSNTIECTRAELFVRPVSPPSY